MKSSKKNYYYSGGFVRTIEEDEDLENNSGSGDSDDEPDLSSKQRASQAFSAGFSLQADFHQSNAWDNIKNKLKSQNSALTTVQQRQNERLVESMVDKTSKGADYSTSKDVVREKKKKRKGPEPIESADLTYMFSNDIAPFQQMNLSRPLLRSITAMNYIQPSNIQSATIPVALLGRDIYACAATGTGKTAAFMLPVLERLLYKPRSDVVTRVLILVPTRELGVQVFQVSQQLAQFTKIVISLAVGGLDVKSQELALRQIPDIVIATPGRLIDHLQNTPNFNLRDIEILILDEADRMLDEFFASQMKEIIDSCSPRRQTMLFSATMSEEVQDLAAVSLKDPVKLFINSNTDVAWNLRQEFVRVRPHREADREALLAALVTRNFQTRTMVFSQTKKQVHRLNLLLKAMGVLSDELHGNLNQIRRLEALRKFQEEEVNVLVTTDVAARGLDIKDVKTIINFTMPNTLQHYIHRVGRTARAGRGGRAISLVGESERKMLKDILKKTQNPIKQRVIPQDVIASFLDKIQSLEEMIEKQVVDEIAETEVEKMEAQIQKAEKTIDRQGDPERKRQWFQTNKERRENVKSMQLEPRDKKRKKDKTAVPSSEDRVNRDLQKVALFQARHSKKQQKPKRMRALGENTSRKEMKTKGTRGKSSFEDELVNTSRKSVKKFRYNGRSNQPKRKR